MSLRHLPNDALDDGVGLKQQQTLGQADVQDGAIIPRSHQHHRMGVQRPG
jgi:hypothetical protein